MKVDHIYCCGCSEIREIDFRLARYKHDKEWSEAREKGTINLDRDCPKHRESKLGTKIASLSHSEAIEIIKKMSIYNEMYKLLGVK